MAARHHDPGGAPLKPPGPEAPSGATDRPSPRGHVVQFDPGAVAYFLFPVYNEGPNLPRLHDDLQTFARWTSEAGGTPRFVFVDDGSGDGTAAGIRAWGIPDLTLLAHPINRGPGAAFQTGFAHVLSQGLRPTDLVVTLEADATSDPVLFGRMLHRVCCEGDDVVLASPYLYGGGFSNVTPARAFVSHVGNFGVKLFLGIRGIATFSCFYRIYSGRALGALARAYGPDRIVTRSGFECALELLLKSVRCGLSISEVPFRVDWARRKGGSKMRLLRTTLAYLRLFARGV